MFFALKKAGVLHKIKGLIIGGITDLEDTDPPLGRTIEEIVLEQLRFSTIPVMFNFPAGHIEDNRAIVFGKKVQLTISGDEVKINYLN
jgi:muramoyltetrapeptide carboxypeptidase